MSPRRVTAGAQRRLCPEPDLPRRCGRCHHSDALV